MRARARARRAAAARHAGLGRRRPSGAPGGLTARAPLRRRLPSSRQVVAFGAAITVLGLHATVAAPLTVIAAVVLAPGLVLLFQRSGRTMRTLLAGATGLATTFVGVAVHIGRVATGTADGADYTGVVAAAAGVALIGLAFTVALHRRRMRAKLLAIPAGLVLLQWFAAPLMGAALITNAARPWVPAAWTLQIDGARDVTFPTTDGVRLAGWYVPGQTGATVILMHGSHGTRADTLLHLRTLTAAGYGVLAFDARGHGESAGRTNALG